MKAHFDNGKVFGVIGNLCGTTLCGQDYVERNGTARIITNHRRIHIYSNLDDWARWSSVKGVWPCKKCSKRLSVGATP